MTAVVLILSFALLWKIGKFIMRMFFTAICYIMGFIFVFVLYALSSTINVITVPILIGVYAVQKHRGGQLPYVGSFLLIIYPTFTDPKLTEKKCKAKELQKTRVANYEPLTDPLYWSY